MIITYKNTTINPRDLHLEYDGYTIYTQSITTFEAIKASVNKLLQQEAKNHNHTIVLYPNYIIIDGYTYNVSPRLFSSLPEVK